MKGLAKSFLVAVQFLTRLPVPRRKSFPADALAKASVFFPVVGLLVAAGGMALNFALAPHVNRSVVAALVLVYLAAVTGGLHEDGLADAADGFGGGWTREQALEIMRDSRVGSFGALAIALGMLARFVFLASVPAERFGAYLVAGQVLSRWTALPLGYFLPPARGSAGRGTLIAGKISGLHLAAGTVLTLGIAGVALRLQAGWSVLAAVLVTILSALYYRRRLGGVTGDCMGATNQVSEAAVYLAGVILK